MIQVRKSNERGHADHGWLDTHHTFSFADYYDPEHMGFRALRVINEDRVRRRARASAPTATGTWRSSPTSSRAAWPTRTPSAAAGSFEPGDVQRMSAGTGVMHSEFNASRTEPVHFLQIWILPERRGIAPGYEQKDVPARAATGPAPPHRLARRRGRQRDDPPGRAGLQRRSSARGRRSPTPSPRAATPGSRSPAARSGSATWCSRPVTARPSPTSGRVTLTGDEPSEVLLFDLA